MIRSIAFLLIICFLGCATTSPMRPVSYSPRPEPCFDGNQEYLVILQDDRRFRLNGYEIHCRSGGYDIPEGDGERFYTQSQVAEIREIKKGLGKGAVVGISLAVSLVVGVLSYFGIKAIADSLED